MTDNLGRPDCAEYRPLVLTPEQASFVLKFYRLDPVTGRRRFRRAVWSRPKGHGKSPLMAAIAAFEALGDAVPDGWDAEGRPVGKPWREVRTPWVQLAAVSEDQTANAFLPLLEMLRNGPAVDNHPGLDPMETFVVLPHGGRIEYITSASRSREGNRPTWVGLDQTESWVPGNGGVKLAAVLRRNLGKTDGTSIESPNAFMPGEGSVAEESQQYAKLIAERRVRDEGLLYDHREAPADTDLSDYDSLIHGLRVAYGDSALDAGGWVDLQRIVAETRDPATDPMDARRFYLNQVIAASDAWITNPQWLACAAVDTVVHDGDTITLGFDGSRGHSRRKADATALIGCRVRDGHLFEIGARSVWEAGPHDGQDWAPPVAEVEAAVQMAFRKYRVVGFYADPSAGWDVPIARWEARWGGRLRVKASQRQPISAWPTGKHTAAIEAVKTLGLAIMNGECSHDGSSALTRHVLNARRRQIRSGYLLYKAYPDSPDKIDGAYAAVMAWRARLDAVAAGLGARRKKAVIARVRGGALG
jgi:hypothetical protein